MKKFSLINALVEKSTSRNGQNRRVERARTLRLENLESRELLSVAPGNEIFALTADEVAVYEAKAAERADDVIDLSGAQLDDAEGGLDPIVVTSDTDSLASGDGVDYKSIYSDVVQARTDAASSAMFELADDVFDELDEEDFDLLVLNALIG